MPVQIDKLGTYFSQIEVAEKLGVVRQNVQYWIEHGILPAVKMVGGWAIHVDDLANFRPPPMGRPRKVRE